MVVVYGCSKEFCNETLDLEGKISQVCMIQKWPHKTSTILKTNLNLP